MEDADDAAVCVETEVVVNIATTILIINGLLYFHVARRRSHTAMGRYEQVVTVPVCHMLI